LPLVGVLIVQTIVGCAARPCPIEGAGKPTPLPTEDGVPVNQWYMNTKDADGTKLQHYIAEYGIESKPGNTIIVLHGGWGSEHSYLVPVIKPLAGEYRFVLYDQRGSLRSPANPPAKITYANLIEDLDQLRQRLGQEGHADGPFDGQPARVRLPQRASRSGGGARARGPDPARLGQWNR
jgi:hypothetical protein